MCDTLEFSLQPQVNERLANLCGAQDSHLQQVAARFHITIESLGHHFRLNGEPSAIRQGQQVIERLYQETQQQPLSPERVHLLLQSNLLSPAGHQGPTLSSGRLKIRGMSMQQANYLQQMRHQHIVFATGPAGTGKTYLAVASAVEALEQDKVRRIILVRPAVEAGERLGFLPGDMAQKVDPYLRPLYDALYEMLGRDRVTQMIEQGVIEIAALAYMRGRTLRHAFVILDEAQNTTIEQMRMFLTRISLGCKVAVTGDLTQSDLHPNASSGLQHAITILAKIKGIHILALTRTDVVRHPLVKEIIAAYEKKTTS